MKKILLLFCLLFLLSAHKCNRDQEDGQNFIIEKSFSQEQELISLRELEKVIVSMNIQPIPKFSSWMTFSINRHNGHLVQRLVIFETDTVTYDIIYNTFYMKNPDSTFYEVKVRKLPPNKKKKN